MSIYSICFIPDLMYQCNRDVIAPEKKTTASNQLVSMRMPDLKRTYLSFHHLCGYQNPSVTSSSKVPCSLNAHQVTEDQGKTIEKQIFDIPDDRLVNDGSLGSKDEWFYENLHIGLIKRRSRVVLRSNFDAKNGGVGLDNLHFNTPQK